MTEVEASEEFSFAISYSGAPITSIDSGIAKHAEKMGGEVSGSGYCFSSNTRDIGVIFKTHMEANKFRAAMLTEPELRKLTEEVKVGLSDITKME